MWNQSKFNENIKSAKDLKNSQLNLNISFINLDWLDERKGINKVW